MQVAQPRAKLNSSKPRISIYPVLIGVQAKFLTFLELTSSLSLASFIFSFLVTNSLSSLSLNSSGVIGEAVEGSGSFSL